jgi:hypothetical protein
MKILTENSKLQLLLSSKINLICFDIKEEEKKKLISMF